MSQKLNPLNAHGNKTAKPSFKEHKNEQSKLQNKGNEENEWARLLRQVIELDKNT